jgi:uncharacterized membrane protein HdeD (DUF308 family)
VRGFLLLLGGPLTLIALALAAFTATWVVGCYVLELSGCE